LDTQFAGLFRRARQAQPALSTYQPQPTGASERGAGRPDGAASDQGIARRLPRASAPRFLPRRETQQAFGVPHNHFGIPASMVADLYRQRWQVELFFEWIKQHLRIKAFFGTSPNAVKTQIWSAISLYLLIAIAKNTLDLPGSLHTILHLLEVNAFEKKPINQLVTNALRLDNGLGNSNQLNLFEN
jgi:transposase